MITTNAPAPALGGNGLGGNGAVTAAPNPGFKFCPKCEQWKEATPACFYLDRNSKDGLFIWCQLCSKTYVTDRNRAKGMKKRPQLDPATRAARRAEYDRAYHHANRDKRNQQKRERYQGPGQEELARQHRESQARYREANREKMLAKARKYYQDNREMENEKAKKRMAERRAMQPKKERIDRPKPPPVILGVEMQKHIDYFLNAKAIREEVTLRGWATILRMFGQHIGDKWPPDADDVNAFLAAVKRRGCSDTTVFNYYRVLSNWFNWLAKRGKLADNPILLTERPPRPKKLPRAPKEEDIKRLFVQLRAEATSCQGARNLALITLALDTGMRLGELVKLILTDVDLDRRRIIVRETKTDRERFCVLSENAVKVLTCWLVLRPTVDSNRLFISQRTRTSFTGSGMYRILNCALKRAKAAHFGMHALRHGYAVYSLRAGANLGDIQKQLGHTDIATTARYLLITDDDDRVNRHGLTSPVNGLFGGAL